jgi:hypothetical protein
MALLHGCRDESTVGGINAATRRRRELVSEGVTE